MALVIKKVLFTPKISNFYTYLSLKNKATKSKTDLKKFNPILTLLLVAVLISSTTGYHDGYYLTDSSSQKVPDQENIDKNQGEVLMNLSENDSTKKADQNKKVESEIDKNITKKLELNEDEEEKGTSILSFNFIHYILYKFKFSDILKGATNR